MKRKILITVVMVTAFALLMWATLIGLSGGDASAQSNPVTLVNPGFEGVYTPRPDEEEVKLPKGWEHWWDRENTPRPEYLEGDVTRTDTGQAVKQFTTYNNVDGGVRQEVYDVTPGQWYEFSIWAHYRSTPPGNKMSAMACINPWGDTDITYRTTVCGEEITGAAGEWIQVSVIAQAWSDKITVAGRFVAEWEFPYSDVFWTDADLQLITIGGACPTPAPPSTVAPCPTAGAPSGECATIGGIEELLRGMTWGVRE